MKFRDMKLRYKIGAGVATGAAIIAGGSAAFAYFTSTGSGTGTGTVGSASGWTVAGGSVVGTLYPVPTNAGTVATPDGVVTGASVTNSSSHANENLNTVVAQITSVTTGSKAGEAACGVSDFQLYSPSNSWNVSKTASTNDTATISPNLNEAPGATYNISDLSVALVDNGAAQDNCQGQTVTITFNAS